MYTEDLASPEASDPRAPPNPRVAALGCPRTAGSGPTAAAGHTRPTAPQPRRCCSQTPPARSDRNGHPNSNSLREKGNLFQEKFMLLNMTPDHQNNQNATGRCVSTNLASCTQIWSHSELELLPIKAFQ